jgi:hypothetical protein
LVFTVNEVLFNHLNRGAIETLTEENKQDAEKYKKKSSEAFWKKTGLDLVALGSCAAFETPVAVALMGATGPAGAVAVGSALFFYVMQTSKVTFFT